MTQVKFNLPTFDKFKGSLTEIIVQYSFIWATENIKSLNGKLMLRGSIRLSTCLAWEGVYNTSLSQVSFLVQSCVYYAKALKCQMCLVSECIWQLQHANCHFTSTKVIRCERFHCTGTLTQKSWYIFKQTFTGVQWAEMLIFKHNRAVKRNKHTHMPAHPLNWCNCH